MIAPVFRHEREAIAAGQRLARAADRLGLAPDLDLAARAVYAEQRLEQFALAVALHAGDPQYFALAQIEVDIGKAMIDAEAAQAKRDGRGRRAPAFRVEPIHAPAQHVGDDRLVVDGVGVVGGDRRAVAEHGDAIGNLAHFAEAVRDVDHQPAGLGEALGQAKQPFRLLRPERRRRFIEDQHLRVARQRLGDLDHLPFGQRQPAQFLIRPDRREFVAREQFQRRLAHGAAAHRPDGRERFAAKPDVLLHRQVGNERQLLEHGRNAGLLRLLRVSRTIRRAGKRHRPAIRAHGSGEDLDERALAGAVLAQQRMHFAGAGGKIGAAEGGDAAIPLGDRGRVQKFGHAGRTFSQEFQDSSRVGSGAGSKTLTQPSPASGRGLGKKGPGRLPLPRAGEGWGEGLPYLA